ncbi:MAG: single-stranded-DNA-specific exonuclease RecJ [Deltaproteobacteria bacterium]|nr:single-stranded-DNA-specific exonuclease RecJ [Deltaproteobacteria bacterium]
MRNDLPSPFLMAGMEAAVNRLVHALERKELICVWGDYDVDGTTGAATLVSFLREIGAEPFYYVPHRIEEGYGLNSEAIGELSSRGVRLIVTVDCGVSNYDEVELARRLGTDALIVDHHEPPDHLPPAVAILNPHRLDCPFPDKGLSAAGLAFYLVIGLRAKLREVGWFQSSQPPDIRRHLDLVALGTVADMVPLRGVNRILVRRGLEELANSKRPGILALKAVAGVSTGALSAGQVAFQLGPRINAAGRMDAGLKVVEMLTTHSEEVAARIAQELDEHNRERQGMEKRVLQEALSKVEESGSLKECYSIVVGQEGWHPGVLGIVASRLVERYHRPTVVVGFHNGLGKGSARSIRGFHMVEGLRGCAAILEKFGGHESAGGLSVQWAKFPLFSARFEEIARDCLTPDHLVSLLEIDAEVDFSALDLALVRELEALKPFGVGNPEPVFMTRDVEVSERRDFNGGCRLRLRHGSRFLGAVAFRRGDLMVQPGDKIDVAYRVTENEWSGTSTVELRLVDARSSSYRPL